MAHLKGPYMTLAQAAYLTIPTQGALFNLPWQELLDTFERTHPKK